VILSVAPEMFRIARPTGAQVGAAVGLGVMAIGWRLLLRRANQRR